MRGIRILWPEAKRTDLEDFDVCSPDENSVMVRTHLTLISPGTERAWLLALPGTPNNFPMYPGYSNYGEVLEIGASVKNLKIGDRVVSDGNHASLVTLPAERVFRVSPELSAERAVFFNMACISLQGIRKANIELGESAIILGLGLVGQLAMQLAAADGAMPVIGVDKSAERLDLAARMGADGVLNPEETDFRQRIKELTKSDGASVVIESTGSPEAVKTALQLAGYRGRVVLLGSTRGQTPSIDFYEDVHKRGILLIGAHNYVRPQKESSHGYWTLRDDLTVVIKFLESNRLRVTDLITHRMSYTKSAEIYGRLMDYDSGVMGVVLDWLE